ncbi:vesicle-associated membrane protein-associated protein A-like isoform X1 [Osmerus eperlanus]|uniref:vesicle-associated membrane protein-associated protein A-like isoform X1 n=2 Tax=Osmerus eperlanus TaxID=29151 RepID=UPI002E14FC15
MSKLEQILVLDPPYDLKFKGPFTDVVTTHLRLWNPSDRRVCFKVKTTAPRRYCVRPNSGMLEPGASIAVSVMLQPFDYDPNEKSKHKFMVQTVFMTPSSSDTEAVWKNAKADDLMDSKLRCVFELPSDNNRQMRLATAGHTPKLSSRQYGGSAATTPGEYCTPLSSQHHLTSDLLECSKWQSEVDASRATPLLSSRSDSCSTSRPSGAPLDQPDMRRLVEECKRLQTEVGKLSDENRQLKDDGVRMRRSHRPDNTVLNSASLARRDHGSSSLPSLLVVIAAIFIGLFLGKFVL